MDLPALTKLLDYGLLGILLSLSIAAVVALYKKVLELEDKRVTDSTETNKTVTIALNTVSQNIESSNKTLESIGSTMKAVLITLDKKSNDKE